MKKTLALLCLVLAITVIVRCSNDYNPFTNRANATIHILSSSSSFADADTVDIYQTHTLALAPTVYELIDSFSLEAEGSRLFSDTTCRAPQAQTYFYKFSWNDTGRTTIILRTYRGNEELERTISVYVRSPLHQTAIDTSIETALILRTPAVRDSAWYHWALLSKSLSVTLHSRQNEKDARIEYPGTYDGKLWVSTDSLGVTDPSPEVPFSVTLRDTMGPFIECLNTYSNDTISTGDKNIVFEAHISDPAGIDTATVQGRGFDKKDHPYYRVTLRGLDAHDATHPLSVKVVARDKVGNLSQRLFYVVYNQSTPQTNATKIEISRFFPDSFTTNQNQQNLAGTIEDNSRTSVKMSAVVNGSAQPPIQIPLKEYVGEWKMSIPLKSGVNSVTLLAQDSIGDTLAEKNVTIIYDAAAKDSTPPTLIQLTANGNNITPGQVNYVADSTVTLAFLAFDNSGIKSATITSNQQQQQPIVTSSYKYHASITNIPKSTPLTVTITLTDSVSVNNITTTTLSLQRNLLPKIDNFDRLPKIIFANKPLEIDITISDDDKVDATLSNSSLPSSVLQPKNQFNSYRLLLTPLLSDTGENSCTFELNDGQVRQWFIWSFHVLPDTTRLIRWATTKDSIPRFIYTNQKESIPLRILPERGTLPISFKALLDTREQLFSIDALTDRSASATIDANDSLDGLHFFSAIACDATGACDTIDDSLWIIPKASNSPQLTVINDTNKIIAQSTTLTLSPNSPDSRLRLIVVDEDHPLIETITISINRRGAITTQPIKSGDTIHLALESLPTPTIDSLVVSLQDAQDNNISFKYLIRNDSQIEPFALSVEASSPLKPTEAGFFDMSEMSEPQRLTLRLGGADATASYQVTVNKRNSSTTAQLDHNTPISITVENSSATSWDTITVAVRGNDGKFLTLNLPIYYGLYKQLYDLQLTTATATNLNDTLYGFPLLVRLNGAEPTFSQLPTTNSNSVAFFKEDGTPLAHEQEYWGTPASTALGLLWVRLDTVITGTPYRLRMGISYNAVAANDAIKPFSAQDGFEGVWHMRSIASHATNSVTGTADTIIGANSLMQTSLMGPALQFDGNSDYINTSTMALKTASTITLSAWFQSHELNAEPGHIFWQGPTNENGWGGSSSSSHELHLSVNTPAPSSQRAIGLYYGHSETQNALWAHAPFTDTLSLHHICAVLTNHAANATATLYLDGVAVATDSGTEIQRTLWDQPLRIGSSSGDNYGWRHFRGTLDEARVSLQARSPAWINLSYQTQKPSSSALSFSRVR